jgi:hypothetical protein
MAHTIEPAKSGRASCRSCREPIAKGELRFGEDVPNAFSDSGEPSYQWHHLRCAATKKPAQLKLALAAFTGEVPDRAELEKTIESAATKVKPATFPYAERAPTGRSKCQACEKPIENGALRVEVEREVDTGTFVTKGAGYLHAACARAHTGDDALLEKIKPNSPALGAPELEELARALQAP